ncbi:MAG: hypothetical protein GXP40_05115 [Chloroflexi bacterium]|nr:hypothetical protein [Chloroflexota bacterium]
MSEPKQPRKFEAETLGLPPLKMVLGNIPVPDPGRKSQRTQRSTAQKLLGKSDAVLRLIDHLVNKE